MYTSDFSDQRPGEITRRTMVMTSLAAGFAMAVRPVSAATITTDDDDLAAGPVTIPVEGDGLPAYQARPRKGNSFPIVLVVQEIFGVHEHIKDVCRRFAKVGYLAVAPELYARQGDVSKLESIEQIRKIVARVPDSQVLSDLDAAVSYATRNGGDRTRLAITGFCWGGRIVWLYAAHNPQLQAGAAWYGRLEGEASAATPIHPVDIASELKAPVLGLYGGQDQGIPLQSVERMRTALRNSAVPAEIHVFADAPHGFYADYRPSYREEDAKQAWSEMLAWFKKHGAA